MEKYLPRTCEIYQPLLSSKPALPWLSIVPASANISSAPDPKGQTHRFASTVLQKIKAPFTLSRLMPLTSRFENHGFASIQALARLMTNFSASVLVLNRSDKPLMLCERRWPSSFQLISAPALHCLSLWLSDAKAMIRRSL